MVFAVRSPLLNWIKQTKAEEKEEEEEEEEEQEEEEKVVNFFLRGRSGVVYKSSRAGGAKPRQILVVYKSFSRQIRRGL